MSKKRRPAPGMHAKRGSFGPVSGFQPMKLMWSASATSCPMLYPAWMPPAAFVSTTACTPSAPSTRMGNVTCAGV